MLKIQELQLGDRTLYIREPRVRDYIEAKKAKEEDYTYALMGQMVLDENRAPIGLEGVLDLPLTAFDQINKLVDDLTKSQQRGDVAAPLTPSDGSSTG